MQSLADYLGTATPTPATEPTLADRDIDAMSAKEFATAVLDSREFRRFIVNALAIGDLPAGVITRLMDYAWGKPVERIEHTGKDGDPIVTEVRRVVIHVANDEPTDDEPKPETMH